MRGHVTRKGKRWYYVYDIPKNTDGKRRQKWSSGYDKKRDAEKALAEVICEMERGGYVEAGNMTLCDYLRVWINNYKHNLAPLTFDGYSVNIEKHIIPYIGNIKLRELNPLHIESLYNELRESGRADGKGGLSNKSILYVHRVLHKALNDAVGKNIIYRNVAENTNSISCDEYEASVLNDEEVTLLIKIFKDTDIFIPVLLGTTHGLRRGEALGLRWGDIDFERGTISINQAVIPNRNGFIIGKPKSKHSIRTLNTPPEMIQILKKHKATQENSNCNNKFSLITCKPDGNPINPSCFSKQFRTIVDKANFKKIRFHDLRHTFGYLLMEANVHLRVAQSLMGHSCIQMTAKYTRKPEENKYAPHIRELVFRSLFDKSPISA